MLLLLLVAALVEGGTRPPLSPCAEITQGRLCGVWRCTRSGRSVAAFLGVPYARPPVGQLRFQNPQPPEPWKGLYTSTRDAPACVQDLNLEPDFPDNPDEISEDCLYLNVFTPNDVGAVLEVAVQDGEVTAANRIPSLVVQFKEKQLRDTWVTKFRELNKDKPRTADELRSAEKLPVLVFFYGGSFEIGSTLSSAYGPEFLLDEDVVLVTVSYRMGILGFLALNHPVLPGNIGLKDQRQALRWVRDNIPQFGGDPLKVTLWGQSSGAASVHLHLQKSYPEGLFRAIIAESGSSRSPYAYSRPGSLKSAVDKLTQLTGCPAEPRQLLICLRELPAQQFVPLLKKIRDTGLDILRRAPVFQPTMEPPGSSDVFLERDPWTTLTNIPILHGTNRDDAISVLAEYQKENADQNFLKLNGQYQRVLTYNQFIDETTTNPKAVGEIIKQFYFGEGKIDRENFMSLVDYASDARYKYPLVVTSRSNKGKSFVYDMAYKGSNSIVHYKNISSHIGVGHCDELFFLFPMGGLEKCNYTYRDTKLSKKMVKMWTNFAKYLDPTPEGHPTTWAPVTSPSIEYLEIGQYGFNMQTNFLKPRMEFWDHLPFRNKPNKFL